MDGYVILHTISKLSGLKPFGKPRRLTFSTFAIPPRPFRVVYNLSTLQITLQQMNLS